MRHCHKGHQKWDQDNVERVMEAVIHSSKAIFRLLDPINVALSAKTYPITGYQSIVDEPTAQRTSY